MNIAEIRKQHHITQKEMAKILNITQSTYSRYETEEAKITPLILMQLADYFNVTTDYLLGRTSDSLLVNSYIPKSEIQELYDQLSESEKRMVKSYIQGILDTSNNIKKKCYT